MQKRSKALLLVMCAIVLVVGSVFGTIAYLTDAEAVTNTFSVGSVGLKLDEAKVDEMGKPDGTTRWQPTTEDPAQEYHLLPGHSYTKDPTVTVDAGSEESYIRMMATITYKAEADIVFAQYGVTIGKRFGKLIVIGYGGKRAGMHRWKCLCDCGNETIVGQTLLQSGKTKSCGCIQAETIKENLKLVDGTSVTMLEAAKERLISSNTSGYTGVYQDKKSGKWRAQITFKKKTYYLGSFEKIEDAIKARRRGEEIHDNFLKWYYSEYLEKMQQRENDAFFR